MSKFRKKYYALTAVFRPLPNFIIIGAQKAGTTSLFHYICQHPQVFANNSKEIHFFDRHHQLGANWYRSHFPLAGRLQPGRRSRMGEATPYYLCHPHAPGRIAALLPKVKLIAVLRHPVERAISHYFHEKKKGREHLPILEAMQREEERCAGEWQRMLEDASYFSQTHQSFSYKQRGIYIEQLQRYWKFFSKEQIFIVESSRLFSKPQAVLKQVFNFLEIDSSIVIQDVAVKNANPTKKAAEPEVYAYLKQFFAPHNEMLQNALGQDFGW